MKDLAPSNLSAGCLVSLWRWTLQYSEFGRMTSGQHFGIALPSHEHIGGTHSKRAEVICKSLLHAFWLSDLGLSRFVFATVPVHMDPTARSKSRVESLYISIIGFWDHELLQMFSNTVACSYENYWTSMNISGINLFDSLLRDGLWIRMHICGEIAQGISSVPQGSEDRSALFERKYTISDVWQCF